MKNTSPCRDYPNETVKKQTKKWNVEDVIFQGVEELYLKSHINWYMGIHGVNKECKEETNCSGCDYHEKDEVPAVMPAKCNYSMNWHMKCKTCPEELRSHAHMSWHMKIKHEETKGKELKFNCKERDFQKIVTFIKSLSIYIKQ